MRSFVSLLPLTALALAAADPATAAVADNLAITGTPNLLQGACEMYTVHAEDLNNSDTPVVLASIVDLGGAGSNGAFYAAADTTCSGGAITEVTIPAGLATVGFRYRKTDAVGSPVTLTAVDRAAQGDDLSAEDGSVVVTIIPPPPADNLAITGSPSIPQGACQAYTVHAEDLNNSDTPVVLASIVDLGGAGSNGAFYAAADTTCSGGAVTEVTIPAGLATAGFRYRKTDTVGSPVTLTAVDRAAQGDDLSAEDGSVVVTIIPPPPADNLAITGLPSQLQGACAPFTVHAEDLNNSDTAVVLASIVDLGGAGSNGAFYAAADTTCSGGAITEVTIPAGEATVGFRYRKTDTVGSPVTLTAVDRAAQGDDLSAEDGSVVVTIVPPPPADNLAITGTPNLPQGACEMYTVHAEDLNGADTAVVLASIVDLGGAGSNGAFYAAADTTCSGGAITEVTIPAGLATVGFRYRKTDTVGSPVTLTAVDRAAQGDDLSAEDGSVVVTIIPPPPADNLAITGLPSQLEGACAPFTVHAEDLNNSDTPVVLASIVDLGGAGSNGAFYAAADTTCSGGAITEVTIPAGLATVGFRYRKTDTVGSPVTLTAVDRAAQGDDLSADDGSVEVTITPAAADRLALSGPALVTAGDCTAVTVEATGATGTPKAVVSASVVDLGGAGANGAFYAAADTTCSGGAITEVTIPAAASSAGFRYRKTDTVGSPVTLTAVDRAAQGDDLSAADGSVVVTVASAAADRLALSGPALVTAGDCSLVTVQATSLTGTPTAVVSSSVVDLGGAGANGAFYAAVDASCSGGAITQVTIPAAQISAGFRYRKADTAGSPVTLTAVDRASQGDDLSAADGSLEVTVAPIVPDRLRLTGPGFVMAGDCVLVTVEATSSAGDPVAVLSASAVDLGGAGSNGAFYAAADPTCSSGAIAEVTIPASESSVGFRYRKTDTAGSPVTLTAVDRAAQGDDLAAADGSLGVTVTAASVPSLSPAGLLVLGALLLTGAGLALRRE